MTTRALFREDAYLAHCEAIVTAIDDTGILLIVNLVKRVVRVSIETVRIVQALSPLNEQAGH